MSDNEMQDISTLPLYKSEVTKPRETALQSCTGDVILSLWSNNQKAEPWY